MSIPRRLNVACGLYRQFISERFADCGWLFLASGSLTAECQRKNATNHHRTVLPVKQSGILDVDGRGSSFLSCRLFYPAD